MRVMDKGVLHPTQARVEGMVAVFERAMSATEAAYEGGWVFNPLTGKYEHVVITLDFASLYPSLMETYNIDHATLVRSIYAHDEHGRRIKKRIIKLDPDARSAEVKYMRAEPPSSSHTGDGIKACAATGRVSNPSVEVLSEVEVAHKVDVVESAEVAENVEVGSDEWLALQCELAEQAALKKREQDEISGKEGVDWEYVKRDDIHISPAGFGFVKADVKHGILPNLMTSLKDERAKVRKRLKQEVEKDDADSMIVSMLDALQNQIKLAANSCYGLCGACTSKILNYAVAWSTTAFGSVIIRVVCHYVNNHPKFVEVYGAKVIGGDTDSIFIYLSKVFSFDAMKTIGSNSGGDPSAYRSIAQEIQNDVNSAEIMVDGVKVRMLVGTLTMSIDSVSMPFLMLAKKNYVKVLEQLVSQMVDGKMTKVVKRVLVRKGLGTRQLTPYALRVLEHLLDMIMLQNCSCREVHAAVQAAFAKLANGEVPNEDLLHTTNMSRELADYGDMQRMHTVAAKQLECAGMDAIPGMRIPWYICNVSTTSSKSKTNRVVAAALMSDKYTLHYPSYIEELQDLIKRSVLFALAGASHAAKLQSLRGLMSMTSCVGATLVQAPKSIMSGAIDTFVTRTAASRKRPAKTQDVVDEEVDEKEEGGEDDDVEGEEADEEGAVADADGITAIATDSKKGTKRLRQSSLEDMFSKELFSGELSSAMTVHETKKRSAAEAKKKRVAENNMITQYFKKGKFDA